MKLNTKPVFYFIAIAVFVSCGNADEFYTVDTIDGVRTVHNIKPLWGDEPKIELQFVRKIGESESEDEDYMFFRPRDVAEDANGNFYVLDSGNYRIQKYDKDGLYISSIGKEGQGPGEFIAPLRMEIGSDGVFYVIDPTKSSILVLNPDGEEIRRIKFSSYNMFESFWRTQSGGFFIPTPSHHLPEAGLITLFDKDSKLVKTFGKAEDYDDELTKLYGNLISVDTDSDDNVYVAFYAHNRIEKYSDDGELLLKVDRQLNYPLGLIKERSNTIPRFNEVSERIFVDHKKRIWVQSYKRQKEIREVNVTDYMEFEVFDNDGILLCRLPLPQFFNGIRCIGDKVYLFNIYDTMLIYEYKIVEK